jgi:hypothetical protein
VREKIKEKDRKEEQKEKKICQTLQKINDL